jgi:hypothetical protein
MFKNPVFTRRGKISFSPNNTVAWIITIAHWCFLIFFLFWFGSGMRGTEEVVARGTRLALVLVTETAVFIWYAGRHVDET